MNAARALRLVSVLMTLSVAHCQWANSIGWGGAGLGKRAPGSSLLSQILRQQGGQTSQDRPAPSPPPAGQGPLNADGCQPDPAVIKLVSSILREQEIRVQQCLALAYR